MGWAKLPDLLRAVASLLWPLSVLTFLWLYRASIKRLFRTLITSVGKGATVELFSFKLKGAVINDPTQPAIGPDLFSGRDFRIRPATQEDYQTRNSVRHGSRFVRLVHRVSASGVKEFPYDVSVYLKIEEFHPHYNMDEGVKRARLNDIDRVEYYFGHFFGSGDFGSWFIIDDCESHFAVRFETSDEVSCEARVYFHDGHVASLRRYLDLEMGSTVLEITSPKTLDV